MGIIRQGVNGGFSGKAGSVVGSSWQGIDYIKGLSKARTKPASQAQLEQQAKFALAVKFLKPIKDMLNKTYAQVQVGKAKGFNMAVRQVLKDSIQGVYPSFGIDYSQVKLAAGSLGIAVGSATTEAGLVLKVTWNPQPNPNNAFADDVITVLMYNPETNIFLNGLEDVTRNAGEIEMQLRPEILGKTLHVYFFFSERYNKRYSDSYYAGSVTVI